MKSSQKILLLLNFIAINQLQAYKADSYKVRTSHSGHKVSQPQVVNVLFFSKGQTITVNGIEYHPTPVVKKYKTALFRATLYKNKVNTIIVYDGFSDKATKRHIYNLKKLSEKSIIQVKDNFIIKTNIDQDPIKVNPTKSESKINGIWGQKIDW